MNTRLRHRIPWFSCFLVATTLTLAAATSSDAGLFETLQRHLALDWSSLEKFEIYRLVSSPFLQTSPGFSRTILGLTAIIVPVFEWRSGTVRTVATFFAGDWLSTLPILAVLKAAAALGNDSAVRLASQPDSGSSSGGFACLGGLLVLLPLRLRLSGFGALGVFFAVRLAYWHRLYDFQHLLATIVGIGVSYVWTKNWPNWNGETNGAGRRRSQIAIDRLHASATIPPNPPGEPEAK